MMCLANIGQKWGYRMTPFFVKWPGELGTGCSSLDKSPPIQDLMGPLQQAPPPSTETQTGAGLPSILTHQPNGTPRTSKDMAGAAATWEANWEPGGCPNPNWVWEMWEGQPDLSSALPAAYVFSDSFLAPLKLTGTPNFFLSDTDLKEWKTKRLLL